MTKIERILLNSLPVRFLARKTKHIVLPGFRGIALYDVIRFFFDQVRKTGLTERAAAVSYNFIMSIPPLSLFLFTLLPHLPFVPTDEIRLQLHTLIRDVIPAKEHNRNLIEFVDGFLGGDSKIAVISFGFILSLFFASNGMMGIMRSFNRAYIGFEKRKGFHTRRMAIRLTVIILSLLLACLLLLIAQGAIVKWLHITHPLAKEAVSLFRWLIIISLIYYSIAFVYRFAPAVKKKWDLLSPGAILATLLSLIATIGFSIFVNNFGRYNALYGSIGTVMVFMIIVFINSLVLLIGYELNVSIHSLRHLAEEREQKESEALTGVSETGKA
jgi:membrane protein